jgi:ribosomal protein S12 methylthiotransferase accessory factor
MARQVLGAKVGIVRYIKEIETDPDDLAVYSYYGELTRTSVFSPFQVPQFPGSGGFNQLRARLAAIGEGIERYALGAYDMSRLVTATYVEVKDRAVDPRTLVHFDETQYRQPDFPFSRFRDDTPMRWVEGYNLSQQCTVLAPASIVYLSYDFLSRDEFFAHSVSTGAAAGSSLEEAILSGIYEVVERDALTSMWLARLPVPQVRLDGRFQSFVERLAGFDLDLYVHYITLDVDIPVFWGMLVNRDGRQPVLAVGAAANLDPERALSKVIEETIQTRMWAKVLIKETGKYPDLSQPENFSRVDNFDLHVLLYAAYDMRPAVDFLLHSEKRIGMDDIPARSRPCVLENIQRCVELLRDKGFEVIAIDVTPADIRDAGFSVVRVLIPGMQPLNGSHNTRHLGNRRLHEVARLFGCTFSVEQANPYPHPFP